jgi:hypothetical protein
MARLSTPGNGSSRTVPSTRATGHGRCANGDATFCDGSLSPDKRQQDQKLDYEQKADATHVLAVISGILEQEPAKSQG